MSKFLLAFTPLFLMGLVSADLHPFDPLTQQEIRETASIINQSVQHRGQWVFNWITLRVPDKSLVLPYFLRDVDPPEYSIPRRATVILLEKRLNVVQEVVVNLYTRKVESWIQKPDQTPVMFTIEDNLIAEKIALADEQVQKRFRDLGWFNISRCFGETWNVAYAKDRPVLNNAIRPIQLYMYGSLFEGDNHFAYPCDFVVTVDLALKKVIQIDNLETHADYDANNRNGNVCPKIPSNYVPSLRPSNFLRKDVHPIHFSQPNGASYQIRGNEITWQKFKFHLGFSGREGFVINLVRYKDGPLNRPLFYRMSLGEVFVPYGDARPPFHQKFPFDMTEFNFGYNAVDLKEAGLCKGGGTVSYKDFYLSNEAGDAVPYPNAVCIYEEDAGFAWAHWSRDNGDKVFHARSQRLTVSSFYNLGNYDYRISWHFYQDGRIEILPELHGIISSQMLAVNVTDAGEFGNVVATQINGQYHQHLFGLMLDPEIDGNENSVSTQDVVQLASPSGSSKNPYGQGFTILERLLRTPTEARTNISPLTGRTWLIQNRNRLNPFNKHPVGYKLVPHIAPSHFVRKDSVLHPKAAWQDYNVWVTKFQDGKFYPAGFYLDSGDDLPALVKQDPDADITNTDIVLWYNFGITHLPRVEDWPVMPVETASVVLKPMNFFMENPALDVPPPPFGYCTST